MKHQMSEIEALCRKRIIYLINEFCNGSQQEFADRAESDETGKAEEERRPRPFLFINLK